MPENHQYDMQLFEDGAEWVVGVDEVGRGPLAGPVTACAVAINRECFTRIIEQRWSARITDSKKLKESERNDIAKEFWAFSKDSLICVSLQSIAPSIIDEINILEATKQAMRQCLEAIEYTASMPVLPTFIPSKLELTGEDAFTGKVATLIDGLPLKAFPYEHRALVKGDSRSLVIGLASILAKVHRDQYMEKLSEKYPQYGWSQNKGYGTAKHREAILQFGATPEHRKSFLRNLS